jgi:hypothetical protein
MVWLTDVVCGGFEGLQQWEWLGLKVYGVGTVGYGLTY